MIHFTQKGDFLKVTQYLAKVEKGIDPKDLEKYACEGVSALASATPVEEGLTANSWRYEIKNGNGIVEIEFHNDNIQNGVPIAIILQYGHATRNGGWVQGRDYINPAIRPIFDKITNEAWREVTRS